LVGTRDIEALRWVGEQYAVPRDILEVILGRLSADERARANDRVTPTVVGRALRRWRDLELVEVGPFLAKECSSVWLTGAGLRLAGLAYRPLEPSASTVGHRHAVARVRAAVEGRDGSIHWVCERELREGLGGRKAHLPDGVVESDRGRTAIEVELTPKTGARLSEILGLLLGEYDRVVYYATPRAAAVVTRAAALHGRRVVVRPYPVADASLG
jgi:hypothetical protein